jgi:uncharacterized membrane protein
MKIAIAIVSVAALMAAAGCSSNDSLGAAAGSDESYLISTPGLEPEVHQGDIQTVTVSLDRGDYFKQDVQLQFRSTSGISVQPTNILVKASASPDVQIQVAAAKDAALGENRVNVTGTAANGEPVSIDFNVKVVAPATVTP